MNLLLLLSFFTLVACRGLKEEFSWTRINYDLPNSVSSRGGVTTPRSRSNSRSYGPISFPGNTNSDNSTSTRPRPRPTRPSRGSTTRRPSNNAEYIYQNNIPMGANVWGNKLFITVPRRRNGVPSSLNFVWVNNTERHNVPLTPYPDYETNSLTGRGAQRFVSVYRVAIDSCDRLWFVDTGLIETLGNPQQIQPPTLHIIDLKTDEIVLSHVFNSSVLRNASSMASLTIDVTDNKCDEAFAYIPDLSGYGLIVYSLQEDKAWRVNHNFFSFEPLAGEFRIGGFEFQWNDGIFSISISETKSDGFRDAYFHSMAGLNQYKVSTRILRNETLATRSYHDKDIEFVGQRPPLHQTSSSDLHKESGVLFLGLVNQNALGCWNTRSSLEDISIVQKDDQKMIYPSDVKISRDSVVVLTNTMPVFLYGNLDYDRTNFRVWVESVKTAIKGTKCESGHRNYN